MLKSLEWILLLIALTINIVIATWIYPDERLPIRNKAMAVGSYNYTIFLLGGHSSPKQMIKYQIKSKTFEYIGANILPINTAAYGQGWTQKEEILYLVDYDTFAIAMYHMNTQQFTTNWIDVPLEMGPYACLASSNDDLFVIGGSTTNNNTQLQHNKLQILNFATLKWTNNTPSMNEARSSAACIVTNDYLWIFGGFINAYSLATNERIELMNITLKSWQFVESLTTELSGLRAVAHNGIIYIIGGHFSVYFNDIIHLMDAQTGAITGTDYLPFKTSFTSTIVVQNVLYVFAGQNLGIHNKWAYFNFPTSIPSTAPSHPPTIPSVAPSSVPSAITVFPSISPSNLPSYGPSHLPSIHSTTDPSQSSSNLHASSSPNAQPSASPLKLHTTVSLPVNGTHTDKQIPTLYLIVCVAGAIFLCSVLCVLVYKKLKNSNKTSDANVIMEQIQMNNIDIQQMQRIEAIEQIIDDEKEDESENEEIKKWLTESVKLQQYYSLFVAHGYDTLQIVSTIKDKSVLQEMGISLREHQTRIIVEICRLNEQSMRKKGEESFSEDDDDVISGTHNSDTSDDVLSGVNMLTVEGDAADAPPNESNNAMNGNEKHSEGITPNTSGIINAELVLQGSAKVTKGD